MMFKILLLLAIVPAVVLGLSQNFKSCRNQPTPTAVNIYGCVRQPCSVRRGSTQSLRIDFSADRRLEALTASVRTTILGITTSYALPANVANACEAMRFPYACPVRAGRRAQLTLRLPISRYWAPVTVGVQVTLTDAERKVVNCFRVNLKVRVL